MDIPLTLNFDFELVNYVFFGQIHYIELSDCVLVDEYFTEISPAPQYR